mmetsp:Transcript_20877/g.51757  ORF Transcript_20877/g.51757 Transcript_20877/m.51757 type:complete len:210 (-) Transcript_20877:1167-1796(-)
MAIGPTIDPEDVGGTGLLWLFLSYGYALYYAADLIGEGSELLLLVPSMAGLVGGVVLPLLGAVPDGAIILFSGLGSIEAAQESLSVGIGALAGSTIMLLTIPWALAVIAGRVDIVDGKATYKKSPKLTADLSFEDTLEETGVALSEKNSPRRYHDGMDNRPLFFDPGTRVVYARDNLRYCTRGTLVVLLVFDSLCGWVGNLHANPTQIQ